MEPDSEPDSCDVTEPPYNRFALNLNIWSFGGTDAVLGKMILLQKIQRDDQC